MSADKNLTMALFQANLDLAQQTGKLLQENAQRWFEFNAKVFADGNAQAESLLKSNAWQTPGQQPEALAGAMQQRVEGSQAVVQAIIENQTAFLTGLSEALQNWQKQSAAAMGECANHEAYNDMLNSFFKQMNAWPTALTTPQKGADHDN